MENLIKGAIGIVGFLLLVCFAACLLAYPTKWLWNDICPHLFNLPKLTTFEALELNLLCGVLFNKSTSSSKKD